MKRKPSQVSDFGPPDQSARVVIRDRGDPDAPNRTIKRAEVYVLYHGLYADGFLSDAEHQAADRLAIAYEIVEGGAGGYGPGGSSGNPYGRLPVSARALQAATDLRLAKETLGLEEYLFALCVCALNRWPKEYPQGPRLAKALQAMAKRWGME